MKLHKVQLTNGVGDVLFETTTLCNDVRFNEEGTHIKFLSKGELIIAVEISQQFKNSCGLLSLSCNEVK